MQTVNSQKTIKALITRPEKKAQQLALSLQQQGIACVNQPLFDYQALATNSTSENLLVNVDLIIFVSVPAVEFANASYPASHWQFKRIFAVGSATRQALQALGINNIVSPNLENSEGLLALPQLNQAIEGKKITIVRGNGGREHLAESLIARGGNVSYLESYQRIWRVFAKDISKQWYEQRINCIVVTSNALLEKLVQLMISQHEQSEPHQLDEYWRKDCLWIAASDRIANRAKELGILQIVSSAGANDQALTRTLKILQNR